MSNISPCAECEERYVSCHSSCDKYQEWKKLMVENKQRISKMRNLDRQLDTHRPGYFDRRFST